MGPSGPPRAGVLPVRARDAPSRSRGGARWVWCAALCRQGVLPHAAAARPARQARLGAPSRRETGRRASSRADVAIVHDTACTHILGTRSAEAWTTTIVRSGVEVHSTTTIVLVRPTER